MRPKIWEGGGARDINFYDSILKTQKHAVLRFGDWLSSGCDNAGISINAKAELIVVEEISQRGAVGEGFYPIEKRDQNVV